tara:strand:- start:507 stop:731 length:225 start_codon:yes stop_codon:yes gene_type:complete
MKELKKELEEIFTNIEFDDETSKFLKELSLKIELVRKNNNDIGSDQNKFEAVLYNLHKLIPEQFKEIKDDKKNT